ncbi:hypothetical protein U1Q18_010615 [Sarracenia purpurea var. burkii]
MSAASAAAAAARFVFRSAAAVRSAGVRLAGGPQPKFTRCPFRVPTQEQLSSRIFRSAVEIRCVCVDSLLPFHTATASALLTSMLSISPRCYGWIPEVKGRLSTILRAVSSIFLTSLEACLSFAGLLLLHNLKILRIIATILEGLKLAGVVYASHLLIRLWSVLSKPATEKRESCEAEAAAQGSDD